jgi:hypothetical protein
VRIRFRMNDISVVGHPAGVGDRVLAVPPHLRRPNGRPRWSLTGTGRRGSEGVTLVYASRSRRLAIGSAGADRFLVSPADDALKSGALSAC